MDQVGVLVLAGGRGGDFGALSEHRTKAAFPIAGHYRVIDFVLSNLSHSGIRQVGIIIQYLPASLMDHVSSGQPWDFDMADRQLHFMTPFVGIHETRWFYGTGDAIAKNLNLVSAPEIEDVVILSGEHVYQMNYRELIERHRATDADITFACARIAAEMQHPRFGNVVADANGKVSAFVEKPVNPVSELVSIGIFCFKRNVLLELMSSCVPKDPKEEFSLARHVLQAQASNLNTQAWVFDKPWHYLADLREYFNFHMDLAAGEIDLFQKSFDVMTSFSDRHLGFRPPAFFAPQSQVEMALVSPGCCIEGSIYRSVLSPGVHIGEGAVVRNSIIFHDVQIGKGCVINNAIIDKDVVLQDGTEVGVPTDPTKESANPITVIPKGQQVLANKS